MKKFIICLMLIAFNSDAKEWESFWINALSDLHHEDYASAEQNFTHSIAIMENEGDLKHSSIYMDRAHLYLILNKYEQALSDINTAISSDNLSNQQRVKAVIARVKAKTNLNFPEDYQEDIEFLAKNPEIKFENGDNHVIIRNMPENKAFRKSIINSFIAAEICESEDDIQQLSSDVCVVNKTYRSNNHTIDTSKRVITPFTVDGCRRWCDANAVAAISWCSNYPELCLIQSCNNAVHQIQHNCRECCYSAAQDVCAAPFGNIVAVMQQHMNPNCGCN